MTVEILEIAANGVLDPITVYWHNYGPGRGAITVTCYGAAWTAYFGAMSGESIQEFVRKADVGYLVTKLGITQWLKQSKRHEAYLRRIVQAIKARIAVSQAVNQ